MGTVFDYNYQEAGRVSLYRKLSSGFFSYYSAGDGEDDLCKWILYVFSSLFASKGIDRIRVGKEKIRNDI